MPSEPGPTQRGLTSGLGPWLRSQGLGIFCGQATVALLAVGSVILAASRDGASRRIVMEDIRGFFAEPSATHLWFYALLGVMALYALNTLLATWHSVLIKWRRGIRAPRAYSAAFLHVAFLVALLAHAVGGLYSEEAGQVMLTSEWTDIGEGREARYVSLDQPTLADGSLRQVYAEVEVRRGGEVIARSALSYNGPISSGLGSELFILTRPFELPAHVRVRAGEDTCSLEPRAKCRLGVRSVQLVTAHAEGHHGLGPMARVRVWSDGNERTQPAEMWLIQGRPQPFDGGMPLVLEEVQVRSALLLRRRLAPSNPLAFASAVLLLLGVGLMWRRFV